jgi:hypothetical protein
MKASEKEYWRGKGENPKTICEKCGEYMYNSYCRKLVNGKQKLIVTGLQCSCGNHVNDENGLLQLKKQTPTTTTTTTTTTN